MASTQEATGTEQGTLQELARRHLWMHFTRMSAYEDQEIPIIVRGEGCYVYDEHGNRYLDGLSALFCVNIGHGRADIAQAGADQAKELGFFTNWSYAHPRAIELAARVAGLAPGDLNRVFFTSGGSEAVESALKLARQYHKLTGNPNKTKLIAREIAYHGTSLGALSATGITVAAHAVRAADPRRQPRPQHQHLPHAPRADGLRPGRVGGPPDRVRGPRHRGRGDHGAGPELRRLLRTARGLLAAGARDLRRVQRAADLRRGHLRLGPARASGSGPYKYDYVPDIITTAKGLTSSYAPMGAVIATDRVAEPFMQGHHLFTHGFTFAGHPICSAVALANIDAMEREGVLENVRANEGAFRDMLESLRDIPIVGDVRGTGYFHAIELVKDQDSDDQWTDEESETLLRGFLSGELYRRGLICRADDRGDPVIQLSPPLIAGPKQFEEIEAILRPVLTEAGERMRSHAGARDTSERLGPIEATRHGLDG